MLRDEEVLQFNRSDYQIAAMPQMIWLVLSSNAEYTLVQCTPELMMHAWPKSSHHAAPQAQLTAKDCAVTARDDSRAFTQSTSRDTIRQAADGRVMFGHSRCDTGSEPATIVGRGRRPYLL
jgi:hypothetical protein